MLKALTLALLGFTALSTGAAQEVGEEEEIGAMEVDAGAEFSMGGAEGAPEMDEASMAEAQRQAQAQFDALSPEEQARYRMYNFILSSVTEPCRDAFMTVLRTKPEEQRPDMLSEECTKEVQEQARQFMAANPPPPGMEGAEGAEGAAEGAAAAVEGPADTPVLMQLGLLLVGVVGGLLGLAYSKRPATTGEAGAKAEEKKEGKEEESEEAKRKREEKKKRKQERNRAAQKGKPMPQRATPSYSADDDEA